MIKKYSLNFYGLGLPDKNNTYKVYLRYLYTDNGKKECTNIPTDYNLTKEDIHLINKRELTGKLQTDLIRLQKRYIDLISVLGAVNNSFPTVQELQEYFHKTQNILAIDQYITEFVQTMAVKPSTKKTYFARLAVLKQYYTLNMPVRQWTLKDIVNSDFLKYYQKYLEYHNKTNLTIKGHLTGKND